MLHYVELTVNLINRKTNSINKKGESRKMAIILKDVKAFELVMLHQGFTKNSLSIEIGMTASFVGQMLLRKRNPSPHAAKKIREALDVPFDELFIIQD